jgi:hypothetical protein
LFRTLIGNLCTAFFGKHSRLQLCLCVPNALDAFEKCRISAPGMTAPDQEQRPHHQTTNYPWSPLTLSLVHCSSSTVMTDLICKTFMQKMHKTITRLTGRTEKSPSILAAIKIGSVFRQLRYLDQDPVCCMAKHNSPARKPDIQLSQID